MNRYIEKSVDPISKREMTKFTRNTADTLLNYSVIDINLLPIPAGRVDLLSHIIYGNYDLWFLIANKNPEYDNPFDLLRKNFDSLNSKKYIRIPEIDVAMQLNGEVSNTLDL